MHYFTIRPAFIYKLYKLHDIEDRHIYNKRANTADSKVNSYNAVK